MTEAQHFESFMRDYQNLVFSTAMRLLANEAEAEDISQEVFLKAFAHFNQLHDDPRAGGWLKKVATRLCLNHLARYRSRWTFFSELFAAREVRDDNDPEFVDERLAAAFEERDRAQVVEHALQTLPAAQRVPLVLYHLDGLSYEEIAKQLGVSLGKVKTDIFRGRESLRRKLRLIPGLETRLS